MAMTEPTQAQIDVRAKPTIIERLRRCYADTPAYNLRMEAANEIERLTAALAAAAQVEKNKADWKVCERCNCWVKRPLEWEPECSEVPDAMTKDFFGTAAAQVGHEDDTVTYTYSQWNEIRKNYEAAAIEQCAQAARAYLERNWRHIRPVHKEGILSAIRSLAKQERT